ncbi:MAG: hypothetical protein WC211_01935 [Dehalococcoidia bacterium]
MTALVTSTSPTASAAHVAAPTATPATGGASFAGALGGQQQRLAATDVLTSMPPMAAEQIKRGGNVSAVHELFKAIKSGEFTPTAEQMGARDCIIATTARAAQAFESPEAMWGTMREMLGAGPALADAVQYARADRTGAVPETAITTREEANAVLGGPIAGARLNWWETAIRFLLDDAHAALITQRAETSIAAPKG